MPKVPPTTCFQSEKWHFALPERKVHKRYTATNQCQSDKNTEVPPSRRFHSDKWHFALPERKVDQRYLELGTLGDGSGFVRFCCFSFSPLSSAAANIATFVLQSAQLQVPLVHFSFRKCKMPLFRMEAAAWWYLGIFVRLTLVCGRVPLVHFSFRKCKMPLFRLEACGWWYLRHFVRPFFS